jgi:tripartite-type tricarboxylate transporter receptor subunit TctC
MNMTIGGRTFGRRAFALLCGVVLAGSAFGQAYPSKPIKLIVPFAAGGPTDIAARLIGEGMSANLGQQIIADNRGAAGGQIAIEGLKASPPDGYTISLLLTPNIVSTLVSGKPIAVTDFTPIAFLYDSVFVTLVNPNAPLMSNVKTMKDLIEVVKANPGKINYTSSGTGSTGHLFGARISAAQGMKWEHVGYKGLGPAAVDLMAGRIAVAFGNIPNDVQFIKEGKLRAVSTSGMTRMARYPETPSLAESGYPQLSIGTWGGIVGPAGMPKAMADRLSVAVRAFFDRPDLVEKVALNFPEPKYQGPEAVEKRLREDIDAMSRVIRESGIKAE